MNDMKAHPERYQLLAWPTVGFAEWYDSLGRGICRRCEGGEHEFCLDMTEEHNECDCATKGHTL